MPEFAAMTTDMDAGIGRILDKLIELDLLENTYLVYLSDNGGRNTIPGARDYRTSQCPLRDGKPRRRYPRPLYRPWTWNRTGIRQRVPVSGRLLPDLRRPVSSYPHKPHNIDGGSLRSVSRMEIRVRS